MPSIMGISFKQIINLMVYCDETLIYRLVMKFLNYYAYIYNFEFYFLEMGLSARQSVQGSEIRWVNLMGKQLFSNF